MRNFGNFFACFFFCSEHVRKHLNQLCSNLPRAGPKARGRNEIRKRQLQLQLQLLCKIRARSRINKRELPEKRMRNVSGDPAGKNPGCIWLDSLGLHYVNKSIPRSFQFGLKEKLQWHRSVWFAPLHTFRCLVPIFCTIAAQPPGFRATRNSRKGARFLTLQRRSQSILYILRCHRLCHRMAARQRARRQGGRRRGRTSAHGKVFAV